MSRAPSAAARGLRALALPSILPAALMMAIVACSSPRDDAGAITADDQRQLNDAAAMLDANSVDANVLDTHESSPHD